jgi:hypothetical protein
MLEDPLWPVAPLADPELEPVTVVRTVGLDAVLVAAENTAA